MVNVIELALVRVCILRVCMHAYTLHIYIFHRNLLILLNVMFPHKYHHKVYRYIYIYILSQLHYYDVRVVMRVTESVRTK